jgi:cephalosporin hydroxylase
MLLENALRVPLGQLLETIQRSLINSSTYCGVRTWKLPTDAWIYQEIIHQTRPDVIVEIGNKFGGSALMLAHLCDALGHGEIIGVDLDHSRVHQVVFQHPRISWIDGHAVESFPVVREAIGDGKRVLVIEDSAHTYDVTLGVLKLYSGLQQPGDYLIIEDTIINHGLHRSKLAKGPMEAVDAFLASGAPYEMDRSRERYILTWNPRGYLRRKR